MAKKKKGEKGPGIAESFVGGLIFTMLLVVVVPVVCEIIIQPRVEELVGDTTFMWFSSSLIVTGIMLLALLIFTLLLGGGAILRRFGIVGIIALIVAYWLLGNPQGAIMPVAVLIVLYVFKVVRGKK